MLPIEWAQAGKSQWYPRKTVQSEIQDQGLIYPSQLTVWLGKYVYSLCPGLPTSRIKTCFPGLVWRSIKNNKDKCTVCSQECKPIGLLNEKVIFCLCPGHSSPLTLHLYIGLLCCLPSNSGQYLHSPCPLQCLLFLVFAIPAYSAATQPHIQQMVFPNSPHICPPRTANLNKRINGVCCCKHKTWTYSSV